MNTKSHRRMCRSIRINNFLTLGDSIPSNNFFSEIFCRGGSRTAVTSKVEHFVIIVKGFEPLTTITKSSILDVAAVLDPPLICYLKCSDYH